MTATKQTGIPEPFLRASTYNCTIEHGLRRPVSHHPGDRHVGVFVLPPFQRGSVWTLAQKTRFIESIWLHLPIASYAVNVSENDGSFDNWLLDGQQRWTAIVGYVNNDFPVFGLKFGELTVVQHRKFYNHPFPSIVTRDLTMEQCQEVYERLAHGGTNHEPKSAEEHQHYERIHMFSIMRAMAAIDNCDPRLSPLPESLTKEARELVLLSNLKCVERISGIADDSEEGKAFRRRCAIVSALIQSMRKE